MGKPPQTHVQTYCSKQMNALRFYLAILLLASASLAKPRCCKPRKPRPDCEPSIGGDSERRQEISHGSEQSEDYFESNEESSLEITGALNCPPCRNEAAEINDSTETMVMTEPGAPDEMNVREGSTATDDEGLQERVVTTGTCENFDCPNPPCQVFCELETGYYPDPRDCRNFCFCSGNVEIPSKYQRCAGGLFWDPNCGEEGCCNWPNDTETGHCQVV